MFPAPPNFSAAVHPTIYAYPSAPPLSAPATITQGPFLPQQQDPLLQAATDPNSPELFKSNVRLVQQQVLELQTSARRVLAAIQNAYQLGNSPAQTEADIAALKRMLALVADTMRQTGVGALPVLPHDAAAAPAEAQLQASTTRNLRVIYERLQRSKDSAGVAANLLAMDTTPAAPRVPVPSGQK